MVPRRRLERLVSTLPDSVLLMLARALSRSRPLAPYHGWHFSKAEEDPSPRVRARMAIWRVCQRRRMTRPVVVAWHHGLRVNLYLGNDLSRQLFVAGCVDPNEFYLLDRVLAAGMVFLDVGANEGVYSMFAARKVGGSGAVYAFEPSVREFSRLHANLELNGLNHTTPIRCGLAGKAGTAQLQIAGYGHEGHNTLGDFVYDSVECEGIEEIELMTLDEFVVERGLPRVDVVKIDVEGAEISVLEGSLTTLSSSRPLLIVEILDAALRRQGGSRTRVIDLLGEVGYEIYRFNESGVLELWSPNTALSDNVVAAHPKRRWHMLDLNAAQDNR